MKKNRVLIIGLALAAVVVAAAALAIIRRTAHTPVPAEEAVECLDVSGNWRLDSHCQADAVGRTYEFSQSGCRGTLSGEDTGRFTVGASGSVQATVTNDTGVTLDCDGSVEGDSLTVRCDLEQGRSSSGFCEMVLSRY